MSISSKSTIAGLILLASSVAATASANAATKRVGDFSLLDRNGYFQPMSYYDDHKAIAFLVQGNGSKATQKAAPEFQSVSEKYRGKVKFFMINPRGNETRAAVQAQVAGYGTTLPVLMDDTQLASEALGVAKTGEAILLDPKSFTVLYRGPVGKKFNAAIDAVLAGEKISRAHVRVKGEKVTYAAKTAHKKDSVSYTKDVAPILAENCARCHREG